MSDREEHAQSLGGSFLVSEIALSDPNFRQTVVMMISHDENGAFGLVVNRPSPFTLGDVVEGMDETPARSIPVFIGGPVQQEILFLLHAPFPDLPADEEAARPLDGVISEPASLPLIDYLKNEWSAMPPEDRPAVRVYAGYSGWGPLQLEGELRAEAWVVVKATREMIFRPDAAGAWEEAFAGKGPLYQIILQTGFKPSMN
ncbi:MAG TPA: YqgE/AlgH family protein [Spirochaetia bacterium]|nr:YqgE/AlgH family protein [Spirochaetia bacterium]